MRAKVICHMLTSANGKIDGPFMSASSGSIMGEEYEKINDQFNSQAWMCGRTTTEMYFTNYQEPDVDTNAALVPEGDYIAVNNAPMYYVSLDTSGKLGWANNTVKYGERPLAHVIEVLTETTSNAYKDFLRKKNISYILAGKDKLDEKLALEKLYSLFGIETMAISGGGKINGTFLEAGMVDEISLVMASAIDFNNAASAFEFSTKSSQSAFINLSIKNVEVIDNGGLWILYTVNNKKYQNE